MLLALILVPIVFGVAAFFIPNMRICRLMLVFTALMHTALAFSAWVFPPAQVFKGWFALDSIALVFLTITSLLFLGAAFYGIHYLKQEPAARKKEDSEDEFLFINAPEARFTGCLLLFLGSMTLVIVSQHLGILWVAVEMTTLASAPLIYFHRNRQSLEATWKYLMVCSVGIALALLGNFFLAVAANVETGRPVSFLLNDLRSEAVFMNLRWLKAAFLCFLVGYGTKMGLAPMHTWLPDAHSESPSLVSALLSGALLNCAFLGLLRGHQICVSAGHGAFSGGLLAGFGVFSAVLAAVFILGQADYKRMLAYSSVEHMGILALGVGTGGVAVFGAVLHAFNHSFAKAALFLVSGNILNVYKSKSSRGVSGVLKILPVTGLLWIAGFMAVSGIPPFGSFISEWIILSGMFQSGHFVRLAFLMTALITAFLGMAKIMLPMALGRVRSAMGVLPEEKIKEPFLMVFPSMVFVILVLMLGIVMPPLLKNTITDAAVLLGASS